MSSKHNQRSGNPAKRTKENNDEPGWTTNILRYLMANPIYAINIHPILVAPDIVNRAERTFVSPEEWIAVNAAAIRENGAESWLNLLLDVLSISGNSETATLFNNHCNPLYTIDIAPDLVVPHPTMITREEWVTVNAKSMSEDDNGNKEDGTETWLLMLLDLLSGNYVAGAD